MAEMSRLQKLSRTLNFLCLALIVLLPIAIVYAWLSWDTLGHAMVKQIGVSDAMLPAVLSPVQLTLGIVLTMAPAAVLIYGLMALRKAFAAFAEGRVFTPENTRAIRIFAWSIVGLHVVEFFTNGMISVIVTMSNPPGQRALTLQFGSDEVIAIFVGLVFVAIAHALEEGRRLADDNASIV